MRCYYAMACRARQGQVQSRWGSGVVCLREVPPSSFVPKFGEGGGHDERRDGRAKAFEGY
jgi:hypothetical protein